MIIFYYSGSHYLGFGPNELDGISFYGLLHPLNVQQMALKHRMCKFLIFILLIKKLLIFLHFSMPTKRRICYSFNKITNEIWRFYLGAFCICY